MKQRQCVVLQGEYTWCRESAMALVSDFDTQHCVSVGGVRFDSLSHLGKVQTSLGHEHHAVIIDAYDQLNPDTLGILVGTIVAGGVLVVILNPGSHSLWQKRLTDLVQRYAETFPEIHSVTEPSSLPKLESPNVTSHPQLSLTEDQQHAVAAIKKVALGHRRRPLVITADRGRGKSSALGIAAAELITQGKQRIIVTAPSLASAEIIFTQAQQHLPDAIRQKGRIDAHQATIEFIAPDRLVSSDETADLVIIDEAAAIPAIMLEKLLSKYARLVFSSTIHGYEGTGRGFAVRFDSTLNHHTPNWRRMTLMTPVRWRTDDRLEAFSFDALLLNAFPVDVSQLQIAQDHTFQFERLTSAQLVANEADLRAMYGLMVLAHYRTRPSDLKMLLDRDDMTIYVLRQNENVMATAWCIDEGPLSNELSEAVFSGERRLKGHLLPQSLLAHAGMKSAGNMKYRRISRIAVHPDLQRQGLGQQLVDHIIADAKRHNMDTLGVSFASSVDVMQFWSANQFQLVRVGQHHDEVSGAHALMMLYPLSSHGKLLVEQANTRFAQQWFPLIQSSFQQLDVNLVTEISQQLNSLHIELSQDEIHELHAVAVQQRAIDWSILTIEKAMRGWVCQREFLDLTLEQQQLCVLFVLQRQSQKAVIEQLHLHGKQALIQTLRQAIKQLLL
jgi:tRNA(Met) cytidine acetyltransferase